MKLLILAVLPIFILLSCSSTIRKDDYKTDEMLVTFNMHIQAGEYDAAVMMISPSERDQVMKDGVIFPHSKRGMKNLKLSQMRKYEYYLDASNKFLGLAAVINGTAQKTKISQEQRKVRLQKRANSTIEADTTKTDVNRPQKVIEYNPYDDPKMNKVIPEKKAENSVEIEGFTAPDQDMVTIKDTIIESAEDGTKPVQTETSPSKQSDTPQKTPDSESKPITPDSTSQN